MNRDEKKKFEVDRREFMRLAGFAVGTTTLIGCSRGVEQGAMPYLVRPEEVTPGKPYWYASVCGACPAACGILAKDRDGRPIKLEGNPDHPLSSGGMCAMGQASVVELYDSQRLLKPLREGQVAEWADVDGEVATTLTALRASGGRVRFLTDSGTGPAERESIATFLSVFSDARHVIYDPVSISAIADAHRETHGARFVPRYRFDHAEVIVGLGADFLGTWISPVEHAAGYRAGRGLDAPAHEPFSYHVQFESRMSLTGSNADRRIGTAAGTMVTIAAHLADAIAKRAGASTPWGSLPVCPVDTSEIAMLAERLWNAPRGKTLVVCGDNDPVAQKLTNYLNDLLGNYGTGASETTLDLDRVANQRTGDDSELRALVDEIEAGDVDALFVRGVNPLYDLPSEGKLAEALKQIGLVVVFAAHENETARQARYVCPEPHFLESWGDSEPATGLAALRQPALRTIGSSRPLLESLATWSGHPATAYAILRDSWRRDVFPRRRADASGSFETFWNRALHDGFVYLRDPGPAAGTGTFDAATIEAPGGSGASDAGTLALDVHPSAAMLDGRHAHNPWLYELPDPIAKTVWDNFAAISPATAEALGLESGDVVRIVDGAADDSSIEIPVLVQVGQNENSVAVALGYGREGTDRFAKVGPQWLEGLPTLEEGETVGTNVAPLLGWDSGRIVYAGRPVRLEKTGARRTLVATQLHHTLEIPAKLTMGGDTHRAIVQETTLAAWREDPASGGHGHHAFATLWEDHPKTPHHWGLAVDLTACTGCSACVISCQAENNIPVVGKDEVRRAREMHWMRIDRYYGGDESDPDVVHMPMMCQHCDNAPCETVCPVQATAQSSEGLNQQIYNRCVGTRYCANNCPFKVRRFNWFDYSHEDRLQNLALNPDVTVRSRGVMEKCSMCVQRIQDAKAESKRTGQPIADGDIIPACAQTCPSSAIVFGDMNDHESRIAHLKHDPRHFTVLDDLGVKPVVGYLTLVRNREDA